MDGIVLQSHSTAAWDQTALVTKSVCALRCAGAEERVPQASQCDTHVGAGIEQTLPRGGPGEVSSQLPQNW